MILPVNIAVSMFSEIAIPFITKEGADNSAGVWEESVIEAGDFVGKISPSTDRDMDILSAGEISAGAQVIHVIGVVLFFVDTLQASTETKQTYVTWKGNTWKVKSISDRSHDGGHIRYGAVRHIDRVV